MSSRGQRVVIAGGGVAALEGALALRALAQDRISVEVLAPEPDFWYRPLAVAEPFGLGEVTHIGLAELAAAAGATFTLGTLVGVDASRRVAHTLAGSEIPYGALLIACGAIPTPAVAGAWTFRGPADTDQILRLLGELDAGQTRRVAFVVPAGAVWSLPAYELALMTAGYVAARELEGVELALVTPEDEPLQLFGRAAVNAVTELLEERGIVIHVGATAVELWGGELLVVPEARVPADRVVALPRLRGQRIDGVPQTSEGFIPVDAFGRVDGLDGVFAAGDITSFPVKQGGIAAQQAVAAAASIVADAGLDVAPDPFRPVLRGLLLTGAEPRFLQHELGGGVGETSTASLQSLWWPPAKIVGRYLAPFLREHAGDGPPPDEELPHGAVPVEVELGPGEVDRLAATRIDRLVENAGDGDVVASEQRTVGDVMSAEPLVVAPEDTLGEVAEKMRVRDVASALVADYGRLIGILTARDLVRAFAGRVHSSEARVREWMTAEPVAVSTRTSCRAAAALMTEYGIHHLPVVDGERPVGMVGMREVVRSGALTPPLTGMGLGF